MTFPTPFHSQEGGWGTVTWSTQNSSLLLSLWVTTLIFWKIDARHLYTLDGALAHMHASLCIVLALLLYFMYISRCSLPRPPHRLQGCEGGPGAPLLVASATRVTTPLTSRARVEPVLRLVVPDCVFSSGDVHKSGVMPQRRPAPVRLADSRTLTRVDPRPLDGW